MIPAPSLSPNIFRYQKCSEKQKGSSTKFFGTVRQKFWHKIVILPPSSSPPLLSIKFFDTRNFAKHRRFPLRSFFGTLRQQIFNRKSWYSPLWHKIFQYVNFWNRRVPLRNDSVLRQNFWNTEGFLYEMIRYWDKKILDRKSWCPPPPLRLIPSIFRYPKLMKH